jgi:hypothetical protein
MAMAAGGRGRSAAGGYPARAHSTALGTVRPRAGAERLFADFGYCPGSHGRLVERHDRPSTDGRRGRDTAGADARAGRHADGQPAFGVPLVLNQIHPRAFRYSADRSAPTARWAVEFDAFHRSAWDK